MKYGFVRVAAAVPAVKVADCKFNAQQIETQIAIADGKGVQIIISPNLASPDILVPTCLAKHCYWKKQR